VSRGQKRISVFVADDHPVYRQGLVEAIAQRAELRLAGEAQTGREGLEEIRRLAPDVAVLDMKLPDLDGLAVLWALLEGRRAPGARRNAR
jgi:two-component system nitrate/nitrite response regulator NarL